MFERAKEIVGQWLGRDDNRRQAHELYVAIAEAARRPVFYRDLGVPDTPEGRYDLLSLHVILVLRRLKQEKEATAAFAQLLFDVMFRDVDDTLREMGVGDLKVGKKVREYAEAFFGRAMAYEVALEGEGDLDDALSRNLFDLESTPMAETMAQYTRQTDDRLKEQSISDIMEGRIVFPEPLLKNNEAA